jgi:hypothetical protein
MGKLTSAKEICARTYDVWDALPAEWQRIIGLPEKGFKMLIWGASGSGKTTFTMHLCKALAGLGRVYYNSIEEGEGRTIQNAFKRAGLQDVPAEKFALGDRHSYDEMVEVLAAKRNRIQFVVIDSIQYLNLTAAQYKNLVSLFPRKTFILISWEKAGGAPKGEHAQGIRYMVDVKCYVKKGVAVADSRFGATEPFVIFDSSTRPQHPQEGDQPIVKGDPAQLTLVDAMVNQVGKLVTALEEAVAA